MSEVTPDGAIRVVLVDDERDVRELLRTVLDIRGGFEVVGVAENGEQAVDVCAQVEPDVVVLDLAMPVMDGAQALPLIRRAAPDSKVLVLSAMRGTPLWAEAERGRADAYVEKSMAMHGLPALVRGLVARMP